MYFPTFWLTFLSIEAKFHRILCQICLYLSVMPKLSREKALNFDFGAHQSHELANYGKQIASIYEIQYSTLKSMLE